MIDVEGLKCTCGSRECGLVWIGEEHCYQCGDCIQKTYARLKTLEAVAEAAAKRPWLECHSVLAIPRPRRIVTCISCYKNDGVHLSACRFAELSEALGAAQETK